MPCDPRQGHGLLSHDGVGFDGVHAQVLREQLLGEDARACADVGDVVAWVDVGDTHELLDETGGVAGAREGVGFGLGGEVAKLDGRRQIRFAWRFARRFA